MRLQEQPVEIACVGHHTPRCAILHAEKPTPTPHDPRGDALIWCYGADGLAAIRHMQRFVAMMERERR